MFYVSCSQVRIINVGVTIEGDFPTCNIQYGIRTLVSGKIFWCDAHKHVKCGFETDLKL